MTELTNDYASTLHAAMHASSQGDSDQAVALFTQAAAHADDNGAALLLLGSQLASMGAVDRAEAAYSSALLRAPELLVARFQLGLLQLTSGRTALAFLTWQKLTQLAPTEPFRCYVLGFMALAQNQLDRCLHQFAQGLELPQSNVALMQDIRNTMSMVQESILAASAAASQASEGAGDASHILLSNYTDSLQ